MDKREHLIATAFELFYREGVHAVGINRVLEAAGIAKKTLYHHFSSKDDLVAATVSYRDQCYSRWLQGRVAAVSAGRPALEALFDALDDWFHGRDGDIQPFHGCFFINVSAEFGDPQHPIHQQCARHKQGITELIRRQVSQLFSDSGAVALTTDAIAMLKEGAIVQAHVYGDLAAARKAKAVMGPLLAKSFSGL